MPGLPDEGQQRVVGDRRENTDPDQFSRMAARGQHAEVEHERQLEDRCDTVGVPDLLLRAPESIENHQGQVHHAHRDAEKNQRQGGEIAEQVGALQHLPERRAGRGQRRRRRARGDAEPDNDEQQNEERRADDKDAFVGRMNHHPRRDRRPDGPRQREQQAENVHVERRLGLRDAVARDGFAGIREELRESNRGGAQQEGADERQEDDVLHVCVPQVAEEAGHAAEEQDGTPRVVRVRSPGQPGADDDAGDRRDRHEDPEARVRHAHVLRAPHRVERDDERVRQPEHQVAQQQNAQLRLAQEPAPGMDQLLEAEGCDHGKREG